MLECIGVNNSSHGPEMDGKFFIGHFPGFCKLLRVGHHIQNHVSLTLSLLGS